MTSQKGRKCKHPGCKQKLNIYNHEIYCHVHGSFSSHERIAKVKK